MTNNRPGVLARLPLLPGIILGMAAAVLLFLIRPELITLRDNGSRDSFNTEELMLLQEGDLILRCGTGLPSQLISDFMGNNVHVSHVAMVVMPDPAQIAAIPPGRQSFASTGVQIKPGQAAVIHTINEGLSGVNGVQIQELAHFNSFTAPATLLVIRPRMDQGQRIRMVALAWELLARRVPFDNSYDHKDPASLYCSELFYHIFQHIPWEGGQDFEEAGGIISFTSFLQPRYFIQILSHNPGASQVYNQRQGQAR